MIRLGPLKRIKRRYSKWNGLIFLVLLGLGIYGGWYIRENHWMLVRISDSSLEPVYSSGTWLVAQRPQMGKVSAEAPKGLLIKGKIPLVRFPLGNPGDTIVLNNWLSSPDTTQTHVAIIPKKNQSLELNGVSAEFKELLIPALKKQYGKSLNIHTQFFADSNEIPQSSLSWVPPGDTTMMNQYIPRNQLNEYTKIAAKHRPGKKISWKRELFVNHKKLETWLAKENYWLLGTPRRGYKLMLLPESQIKAQVFYTLDIPPWLDSLVLKIQN